MTETIRAFIAIELSREIKEALSSFVQEMRNKGLPSVRWVNPSSIHLTLKFLGDIPSTQANDIGSLLDEIAQKSEPFHIQLGETGVFPNMRAPRVIWIGLSERTGTLTILQKQVEEALASLGFSPENRPFTPHLTLGRMRNEAPTRDRRRVADALSKSPPLPQVEMRVEVISLMQSTLTPSGALYQRIAAFPLRPERELKGAERGLPNRQ